MAYQYMWRFDLYIEPMIHGRYPQRLIDEVASVRDNLPAGYQEDLDKWFAPMDFIGLNYYSPEAFVADTIKTPGSNAYRTACAIGVYSEMARIRFIENANK